jgi:hypothetical protein
MRMIFVLAAACITFASTLPASAQNSVSKSCPAVLASLDAAGRKACVGFHTMPTVSDWDVFLGYGSRTLKEIDDFKKFMDAGGWESYCADGACRADLQPSLSCLKAYLNYLIQLNQCSKIKNRNKNQEVYRAPHAPVTPRDPVRVPPGGLLETTPGLSPQGPAGMGTPSGGGHGPVSGAPIK